MWRLLALALLIATTVPAADWPQLRGPNGFGVSPDKNLPVQFGPQKNVVWKTELPPGHSSPILVGPRIFVTAYEGEKLLTIALDRATGDRKSTRLNSSHQIISYAVFCLKKKKNNESTTVRGIETR